MRTEIDCSRRFLAKVARRFCSNSREARFWLAELLSTKLLVIWTLVFFISFFYTLRTNSSNILERLQVDLLNTSRHIEENENRFLTWKPHDENCRGNFNVYIKRQGYDPTVILTVREAVVDQRHVSFRDAQTRGYTGPFRRILVLMTVLPIYPPLNNESAIYIEAAEHLHRQASLISADGQKVTDINTAFDYLIEDGRCQKACGRWGHCAMREWQAVITFTANSSFSQSELDDYLDTLSNAHFKLMVQFPVILLTNGKVQQISLDISLACVAHLSRRSKFPISTYLPSPSKKCNHAKGAVAFAGAPMFGSNSSNKNYWKQIAHYSARHLFGHTWFDTVVIAIHPKYTIAQIQEVCHKKGNEELCVRDMHKSNTEFLTSVQLSVEKELSILLVPQIEWSRIIITQFCGLGSDFNGLEKEWPCQLSHQGGQKVWGHFSYAVFSRYHKWSSNFDLDEFLVDELAFERNTEMNKTSKFMSAETRFNLLEHETKKTSFYAEWLDFQIKQEDMTDFTQRIMKGNPTAFRSFVSGDTNFNFAGCYGAGGKVITSCRASVSFMIHYALIIRRGDTLANPKCFPGRNPSRRTLRNETKLFTWHARRFSRQGSCIFDPSQKNYRMVSESYSLKNK